jgi:alkylated DNA repair dioxygenase AlkB
MKSIASIFAPRNGGKKKEKQEEEEEEKETIQYLTPDSFIVLGKLPEDVIPDLQELLDLKPETPSQVVILGKMVYTPRFTAHYMKPYRYTGADHDAERLPAILQPMLDFSNNLLSEKRFGPSSEGKKFNQALTNYYMYGDHYIGKHSDDEKPIVPGTPIFSASLGEQRTFRIRRKKTGEIVRDIQMLNGTFVVMGGKMQSEFTHEVVKVMGKRGANLKPRVNITFRIFK